MRARVGGDGVAVQHRGVRVGPSLDLVELLDADRHAPERQRHVGAGGGGHGLLDDGRARRRSDRWRRSPPGWHRAPRAGCARRRRKASTSEQASPCQGMSVMARQASPSAATRNMRAAWTRGHSSGWSRPTTRSGGPCRSSRHLCTSGAFLFGGCGLAAAISALEGTSGRPLVWATGQYLSYAKPGEVLDIDVTIAVDGHQTTQARAVGRVGNREIITVNAALGDAPGHAERAVRGDACRRAAGESSPARPSPGRRRMDQRPARAAARQGARSSASATARSATGSR